MQSSTRQRWAELAGVEGLVSEHSGTQLSLLASKVSANQAIVNIGVFKGKSTCYLAEGARLGNRSRVYAIDPWDLPGNPTGKHQYHKAMKAFQKNIQRLGFQDKDLTWFRAFSSEIAAMWNGPEVGLLFIDGDHSYASVREDWYTWYPHLAEEAVVVFDDYQTKKNPGVEQFVHELMTLYPEATWEIQHPLAICRLKTNGSITYRIDRHNVDYTITKPSPRGDKAIVYARGGRLDTDLSKGQPYESGLLEEIKREFTPHHNNTIRTTFVDVGAHIGNHTIWLAKVCGFLVQAFEPDPDAFNWLEHNVRANGLERVVETHRVALCARSGMLGPSSITPGLLEPDPEGEFYGDTLDSYGLSDVAGIKIDVEGAEPEVLLGARGTLERCKPIIWAEATTSERVARIGEALPLGYRLVSMTKVSSPLGRWEHK